MNLLGRNRASRVAPAQQATYFGRLTREPRFSTVACSRCGDRDARLIDPDGRWFVCARCGHRTEQETSAP